MKRLLPALIILAGFSSSFVYADSSIDESSPQFKQEYQKALSFFHEAAKNGDADAQAYLGVMYGRGQMDVKQDYAKAAKWYRKAAEQGEVSSQYHLARLYSKGKGVKQGDAEAVKWFRKAADQG